MTKLLPAARAEALQLRATIKDRVSDSSIGPRLFEAGARVAAPWVRRRGGWFREAELLLRAWRLLGSDRVSGATRRRVETLIREACHNGSALAPISENRLLREFEVSAEADRLRRRDRSVPVADVVRMRHPDGSTDPERQGNVMLLKPYDEATGERGVLIIKYGPAFRWFAATFDLSAVAARYAVVLEPSWWGYQDASFLLFMGAGFDVVVLAQRREDYEFIQALDSNLVAVRLGAGDWVDPETFRAGGPERTFDVVSVASWNPLKRHALLFASLAKLRREQGRSLRVALIGYRSTWTRREIEGLMDRYGVRDQCTVFERLPHHEVARVVSESKCSVVLSRREGANKALYESLFCGTPVVVYRHQVGVNLDIVSGDVGRLADDEELPATLLDVVDRWDAFRPREWAMANTGCVNSTRRLGDVLCGLAARRGQPWTRDLVVKKNAPNLWYAEPGVYRAFEGEYTRLADLLRVRR